MKSAGKARNNGLYRHIRTSKEIIRNLLNDYNIIISQVSAVFNILYNIFLKKKKNICDLTGRKYQHCNYSYNTRKALHFCKAFPL